jgi:hypothetical protein
MSDDLFDPDEPLKAAFPGFERFIVTWHIDVIRFGRGKLSLGICSKTGGVAFAATDYLHPLIVRDVLTNNRGCDDALWCIDLSCPFNRADPKKMKHYAVKTAVELKRLHERLEDIKVKLKLGNSDDAATQILYQKPAVTLHKVPKHA